MTLQSLFDELPEPPPVPARKQDLRRVPYQVPGGAYIDGTGQFSVGFEEEEREDKGMTEKPPRIEIVGSRDPDGPTDITLFVDGVKASGYQVTIVDPGYGWQLEEWRKAREDRAAAASPAAAALIRDLFNLYEDSPGVKHPYQWEWPQHDGAEGELCEHSEEECEEDSTRCPAGHEATPTGWYPC